jgi:DNA invertase Pin-like site-specific DNA recombinase
MVKYVIYRRVSTQEQGKSGLGLEAQDRDIKVFLESFSEEHEVVAEITEVSSGAKDNRPELSKALKLCRKEKATLLVSKLDRLSRKMSFIAYLLEDKTVNFKVASMPYADTFQLHIYAALAEQERTFISMRTKAALREAKARGKKLGGLRAGAVEHGKALKVEADKFASSICEHLAELMHSGAGYTDMARHLNAKGIESANGGLWSPTTVRRVILRAA